MKIILVALLLISVVSCAQNSKPVIGTIERYDSAINQILGPDAKAEIIASGYAWSEGPLWVASQNMLLFSDVKRNTVFKWTEEKGAEVYLTPSGYTGSIKRGGETGSNGLLLDNNNRLVLCQHGDRRMARMDAPLDNPAPNFTPVAVLFQGKKFNSPNDAVYTKSGNLYFTDPPYGLEKNMDDPGKEMPFQGVYRVNAQGEVTLVTDTISRPNGIAFFPGEKTFIVANSDGAKPNWYAYDINDSNQVVNPRLFYPANGGADGLKIDKQGNVFATGPGGIWIFNKTGKLLGKLLLKNWASNCALSPDEKTLYITNDMNVLRFTMR